MEGGLWGETEGVGREESAAPVPAHLQGLAVQLQGEEGAERRVERGDDTEEEMDSEEEEVEGDSCLFGSTDLLSSILRTAAKSDGFFRHQQVIYVLSLNCNVLYCEQLNLRRPRHQKAQRNPPLSLPLTLDTTWQGFEPFPLHYYH